MKLQTQNLTETTKQVDWVTYKKHIKQNLHEINNQQPSNWTVRKQNQEKILQIPGPRHYKKTKQRHPKGRARTIGSQK